MWVRSVVANVLAFFLCLCTICVYACMRTRKRIFVRMSHFGGYKGSCFQTHGRDSIHELFIISSFCIYLFQQLSTLIIHITLHISPHIIGQHLYNRFPHKLVFSSAFAKLSIISNSTPRSSVISPHLFCVPSTMRPSM